MTSHAHQNERQTLLPHHSHVPSGHRPTTKEQQQRPANPHLRRLKTLFRFLTNGLFGVDWTTYAPVAALLHARTPAQRDRLTERWRDSKLAELNFIGIVAALLAGCLTSTGSWPTILPQDAKTPWTIRTSFFAGIVFALTSILCAANGTIRLHRLSAHPDALRQIRRLLARRRRGEAGDRARAGAGAGGEGCEDDSDVDGEGGASRADSDSDSDDSDDAHLEPSKWSLYVWQLPVVFLTLSVLCMLLGMWALVWSAVLLEHRNGNGDQGGGGIVGWGENEKVAVAFSVLSLAAIAGFLGGQVGLFGG